VARSGQESIAQGLPWVSQEKCFALKGPERDPKAHAGSGCKPMLAVQNGPFRANSAREPTQGKPWAMLFWPLRAMDLKSPNCRALRAEPLRLRGIEPPEHSLSSRPGFQPWEPPPEQRALTRHMNVRAMNNTRSSGLEMLKGRRIERKATRH
jgi:hypothetical protein